MLLFQTLNPSPLLSHVLLFATSAGTCVQNFDFEISSSHNPGDPPSPKKMVFINYPSPLHRFIGFFRGKYIVKCECARLIRVPVEFNYAILVRLHFNHICISVLGVLYIFESLKT